MDEARGNNRVRSVCVNEKCFWSKPGHWGMSPLGGGALATHMRQQNRAISMRASWVHLPLACASSYYAKYDHENDDVGMRSTLGRTTCWWCFRMGPPRAYVELRRTMQANNAPDAPTKSGLGRRWRNACNSKRNNARGTERIGNERSQTFLKHVLLAAGARATAAWKETSKNAQRARRVPWRENSRECGDSMARNASNAASQLTARSLFIAVAKERRARRARYL